MKIAQATAAAIAVAAAALLGAAAAPKAGDPAAPAVTPQCFAMRDVGNHRVAGDRELYLSVTGRGVYRLTMANACLTGAMSSDPLVVRSPNSQRICRPLDLDIAVKPRSGIAKPCIVASIALLAPAEVAALPPALRP